MKKQNQITNRAENYPLICRMNISANFFKAYVRRHVFKFSSPVHKSTIHNLHAGYIISQRQATNYHIVLLSFICLRNVSSLNPLGPSPFVSYFVPFYISFFIYLLIHTITCFSVNIISQTCDICITYDCRAFTKQLLSCKSNNSFPLHCC